MGIQNHKSARVVLNYYIILVAAAVKELQTNVNVVPFMLSLVRHFTLAMIAQQAGPFMLGEKAGKLVGTDAYVLIGQYAHDLYYNLYGTQIASI